MDTSTVTIHPELLKLSSEQFQALLPYFWVFGGTVIAIFASVLRKVSPKWPVFILSIATVIAGLIPSFELLHQPTALLFNEMMVSDVYANLFNIIFLIAAVITLLASFRYLDREQ